MTEEIWKDIPGYEGLYQVSDLGRVKSLARRAKCQGGGTRLVHEKMLSKTFDKDGYLLVVLFKDNKRRTKGVHRLVIDAFEGLQKGLVVDHINNIKDDNRYVNLQQITVRHNSSKDQTNKTSNYTGVCWREINKKWIAQIVINKKVIYLGSFINEQKASEAYQNRLKEVQDAEKHRFDR